MPDFRRRRHYFRYVAAFIAAAISLFFLRFSSPMIAAVIFRLRVITPMPCRYFVDAA